ncbi:hypothetical protein E2C01_016252 [Portunus trituberculatus]|uniref:Chitin-binding type-2 domain-containing protein n=1 Tax=Portunus trituberculatus TaxID=210409 RepID=A0A5B7DNL1_PORTR|nr:hypothetical protein [Portunus trituberculatus]
MVGLPSSYSPSSSPQVSNKGLSACQQRSLRNTGNGRQRLQSGKPAEVADFNCPQDFGYYPHPTDCTQYYVCVFGGALQESCTGGLVYSFDKFDHSFSSTKNHRTTQTLNGPDRSGNERALFRNPSSKSQFLSSHFSSSSFFNAPGTSGSTNRRPTKSTSFTPS